MSAFISSFLTNTSSKDNFDKQTQWYLLKISIREKRISYGKKKSIKSKKKIIKRILWKKLQNVLSYYPINKDEIDELQTILYIVYFLGLEKSTQSNNNIRSVNNKKFVLITKPVEVLN